MVICRQTKCDRLTIVRWECVPFHHFHTYLVVVFTFTVHLFICMRFLHLFCCCFYFSLGSADFTFQPNLLRLHIHFTFSIVLIEFLSFRHYFFLNRTENSHQNKRPKCFVSLSQTVKKTGLNNSASYFITHRVKINNVEMMIWINCIKKTMRAHTNATQEKSTESGQNCLSCAGPFFFLLGFL